MATYTSAAPQVDLGTRVAVSLVVVGGTSVAKPPPEGQLWPRGDGKEGG